MKLLLFLFALCLTGYAQEIRIYSEFERFDPFGSPVPADRNLSPREILSPAMARNGHLSVHIVVTAPAGTNYLLYAASNPPDILTLRLYREYFSPCGTGYCPDWIVEQHSPSFGAIPESLHEMPGQTTRCYLLDILATPATPPRRVRVEALLKTGTWFVAPMEVRIMAPVVPNAAPDGKLPQVQNIAPLEAPASLTAHFQLLRYLAGLQPQMPPLILRLRDITQRNAAEDMLLAESLRPAFPELNLLSWSPLLWPAQGAEWFLKIRDFLYNLEP